MAVIIGCVILGVMLGPNSRYSFGLMEIDEKLIY